MSNTLLERAMNDLLDLAPVKKSQVREILTSYAKEYARSVVGGMKISLDNVNIKTVMRRVPEDVRMRAVYGYNQCVKDILKAIDSLEQ